MRIKDMITEDKSTLKYFNKFQQISSTSVDNA